MECPGFSKFDGSCLARYALDSLSFPRDWLARRDTLSVAVLIRVSPSELHVPVISFLGARSFDRSTILRRRRSPRHVFSSFHLNSRSLTDSLLIITGFVLDFLSPDVRTFLLAPASMLAHSICFPL